MKAGSLWKKEMTTDKNDLAMIVIYWANEKRENDVYAIELVMKLMMI